MKKIIFLLLIISTSVRSSFSQHACCAGSALALYSDKDFIGMHLSPMPFDYVPESGKMVQFKAPDGKDALGFEVTGSRPSDMIFMFHEWWGLNDYIKQEAEKLSKATGASVLALDLYDGKVTSDPEKASSFAGKLDDERVRAIISGAIDHAGRGRNLQTIGWCMGGYWSLQAALMAGPSAKGCVMYYGMPETDAAKLSKLSCPVLGIFGTKDKHINPEVVNAFQNTMKSLNKKLTVYNYEANHAFANPSNPQYDKEATADAMEKTIAFIKSHFSTDTK